jgi:hypothetical protein
MNFFSRPDGKRVLPLCYKVDSPPFFSYSYSPFTRSWL